MAINRNPDSLNNDYDAVDIAVQEIAEKNKAQNKILRSKAWRRFFKYASMFVIALAIAIWTVFLGLRHLNKPYFTNESSETKTKQFLKEEFKDPNVIVENFTRFTSIPSGMGIGWGQVVVGRQYKDEFSSKPNEQWCYIEKYEFDGTDTNISLKTKKGEILKNEIYNQNLNSHGISKKDFNRVQSYCIFD